MSTTNAIAIEAYKKYILFSLIHLGQVGLLLYLFIVFDVMGFVELRDGLQRSVLMNT